MSNNTKSCIAFLAVIALTCLIAWLGGYNFDQRNGDVARGAVLTLILAGGAAMIVRSEYP